MPASSLSTSYFDDVYRASNDPWSFETSPYERAKYEATLAALPRKQYKNAFEIGCSIGVLSQLLASRCEALLSVDASELPLETARARLESYKHVTVRQLSIPDEFPEGQFDLILLSEVGYYLAMKDLQRACQKMIDQLTKDGHLLLVHWTPVVHDYPLTGDQVHETFMEMAGADKPLKHLLGEREETYRLDLFQKV